LHRKRLIDSLVIAPHSPHLNWESFHNIGNRNAKRAGGLLLGLLDFEKVWVFLKDKFFQNAETPSDFNIRCHIESRLQRNLVKVLFKDFQYLGDTFILLLLNLYTYIYI
jgi:hypothetical protein